MPPLPGLAPLRVPVDPDRATGALWAQQELSRPEYRNAQPSALVELLQRLVNWLGEQFSRVSGPGHSPGAALAWGIVTALLILLVVVVYRRVGGVGRRARKRRDRPVFGADQALTAAEHRERSLAAAAAGDLALALAERFRAIGRQVEERGLLDPAPGRTATELADRAAAELAARTAGELPELAARLRAAAGIFDATLYGGTRPGPDALTALIELDDDLRRTRFRAVADTVATAIR